MGTWWSSDLMSEDRRAKVTTLPERLKAKPGKHRVKLKINVAHWSTKLR